MEEGRHVRGVGAVIEVDHGGAALAAPMDVEIAAGRWLRGVRRRLSAVDRGDALRSVRGCTEPSLNSTAHRGSIPLPSATQHATLGNDQLRLTSHTHSRLALLYTRVRLEELRQSTSLIT